jgi:hypothetical protein
MFKEYDVVELTCNLSDRLPVGTRGTIVLVYPGQNDAFEVEFTNANHETIELRSGVRSDQLKVVWTESEGFV